MGKPKIFVIMPFANEFLELYEVLKKEFETQYNFSNAGGEGNQQNILKDIIQPIYEADIIIADLTGLNANVMYELGLAHSFNKKTIIITQDDLSNLPFDLKQYRAKNYTTHFKKFAELVDYLGSNIDGALSGIVAYSNPVKDFLSIEKIKDTNWFSQTSVVIEVQTEGGFLDFLADIEENAGTLNSEIRTMTEEMQEMTAGISKSTSEINRVKNNGGSGIASFIRKETRRAAEHVEGFAVKLGGHNKTISSLWNEIEKNTLGLLENKFAANNKKDLVEYLKSLYNMQGAITGSNDSVTRLKSSMQGIIGMERSMNQAIILINDHLLTYLTITEQINNSIDKILKKSKYVVGAVDFNAENTSSEE
ncbi:MAG: hypothetical protein AAGU14_11750 [Eubacteriaceae bacterium]